MTENHALSTDALEDVAYLSRSANRVRILGALANGPYERRELQESTGTSRTTLDRIVNELEQRGWAERTPDGTYVATPAGEHLVYEFGPFVESVEAIRRLGETVSWLPTGELSIGFHHFADATVMRPENDVVETVDYMDDLIREADEFRVLSDLTPPEQLERAVYESVVSGDLSMVGVITADTFDLTRDRPRRNRRWREMVEAGAELFRYEGSIPCNLWTFDGTVLIKKSATEPIPESYGVPIVSENERVCSWANGVIDDHRRRSTRLDERTLERERTVSGPESDDG